MSEILMAHIAPTNYTELGIHESTFNMVLAHIADKDDRYAELFKGSDKPTLLDNGAFELGVPYPTEKMVAIGAKVGADIMVLPDYPLMDWKDGWTHVDSDIKAYKAAGFKAMFVPQSLKDDGEGYMKSLTLALDHDDIDFVGLSILGCPNAFPHIPTHKVREKILDSVAYLKPEKKFHVLGMLDNPLEEITRLTYYSDMINSWDTSLAIWAGLCDVRVDMNHKKIKTPVDFAYPIKDFSVSLVLDNIQRMRDAL